MELLRKKDLTEQAGIPKSTVSDWISEYEIYIPIVKQGNRTYYKPETVEVLKAIKELREKDISKTQIAEELASRFTINAELTADIIEEKSEGTEGLIAVMATMGKVVEQLGRNDEQLRGQERKQAEQDKLIENLKSEVAASREKSAELEARIRAMEEEKPKGWLSRLFGGK